MGVNYDANVVIREDMFFVSSILGIIFGGWIYKSLICERMSMGKVCMMV